MRVSSTHSAGRSPWGAGLMAGRSLVEHPAMCGEVWSEPKGGRDERKPRGENKQHR